MDTGDIVTIFGLASGFIGWAWGFDYGYSEGRKDADKIHQVEQESPDNVTSRLPYQVKERDFTHRFGNDTVWPWTGGAFEKWRQERRWRKAEAKEKKGQEGQEGQS